MKIGLVLSQPPTYSETFFNSKIKGLKDSGFHVTLFVQKNIINYNNCTVSLAPKVYKNVFIQSVKSVFVFLSLLPYYKRILQFLRLERNINRPKTQILKNIYTNSHLLKANLDWVHFGFATIAIQSENVANSINAKMAVSLRGYDIDFYPLKFPDCYDLLWNKVDKVHAISIYLLKKAYVLGMSKKTPYEIISPAVDILKFGVEKNKIFNTSQFLTIARLHPIKGLSDTIIAMSLLKKQDINFKYIIVGNGVENNNLKSLIKRLDLSSNVFLVGKKNHNEVINFLDNSSIYIQYSESEGFCNAVLEAQAKGLLCVVSDGGALPENVLDNETGWVVPKKKPIALANTILKIINLSEQMKTKVSLNAQKRVKAKFDLVSQKEKFRVFYENN